MTDNKPKEGFYVKRTSKLFLIATLVLAISIPAFALAASEPAATPLYGTGYMGGRNADFNADVVDSLGNAYALSNGYSVDAGGFCYYLDANGTAQRLYLRAMNGQNTALQIGNGPFCWALDNGDTVSQTGPARMNTFMGGRGGRRWN